MRWLSLIGGASAYDVWAAFVAINPSDVPSNDNDNDNKTKGGGGHCGSLTPPSESGDVGNPRLVTMPRLTSTKANAVTKTKINGAIKTLPLLRLRRDMGGTEGCGGAPMTPPSSFPALDNGDVRGWRLWGEKRRLPMALYTLAP